MKRNRISTVATAAVLAGALAACTQGKDAMMTDAKAVAWGYDAKTGPAKWGSLSPAYRLCDTGKRQSPIDLPTTAPGAPGALRLHYRPVAGTVVNTGCTFRVDVADGSSITLDGKRYDLVQFHVHTPSEYKIAGRAYPMGAHFVHRSKDGKLAVIGVLIRGGGPGTSLFDKLPLPARKGDKRALGAMRVDVRTMLPRSPRHYRFAGSLTTPPCSEGVSWVVMRAPIRVATSTIRRFRAAMGNNARPVQPRHRRPIAIAR
jgi:carbonic anhydrase